MSDDQMQPDPIELLRRADPVDPDRLPPGSEARLRARVLEDTMANQPVTNTSRSGPRRFWPALYGAGVVALVVAVFVGTGLLGPRGVSPGAALPSTAAPSPTAAPATAPPPAATGGPISGGGMAMCIAMYDLETLKDREWAFDGTATAIDGNEVTFSVTTWFRAGRFGGETVTVTADGMTSESGLLGGPGLVVGGRYLVTGEEEFAWSCGFTQYWNEATAADWERVLAG